MAQILDISVDTPSATDRVLIDTNVWMLLADSTATQSALRGNVNERAEAYLAYFESLVLVGATLGTSMVSICELCHHIENDEGRKRLGKESRNDVRRQLKALRHDPHFRGGVVKLIRSVISAISQYSAVLDMPRISVEDALAGVYKALLDPFDSLLVAQAKHLSYNVILTDDSDFLSVHGVVVATGNKNMIAVARDKGRLAVRPKVASKRVPSPAGSPAVTNS